MAKWRSDVAANLKNFYCYEIYQRRQGQDTAGVWRPDRCRQGHVVHGQARDLFQVGGYPAPGVATSALTFVTVLLTLKPVSLVEHEHARLAETGIFEFLKVPGMVSCLALITSPHERFLIHGFDAADARGRCALQLGQFRCQHGLLLFDCEVPCERRGDLDRARRGVTGLLCTFVLGSSFPLLGLATYVSSVPQRTTVCVS